MSNKVSNDLLDFMNQVQGKTASQEIETTSMEHKELVSVSSQNSPRVIEGELILADEDELEKIVDTGKKNYNSVVDKMLKTQRMSDLAGVGDSMNELIATAKGLDPEKIKNQGFIKKIKSFLGNAKEQFERETDSVLARIETLSQEVAKNIQSQVKIKQDFIILDRENNLIIEQQEKDIKRFEDELNKVSLYRQRTGLDDATLMKIKSYEDRLNFFLENLQNDKIASQLSSKEIHNSLESVVKIVDAIKSNESNLINNWKMTLNTYFRDQFLQESINLVDKMRAANEESLAKRAELNNSVSTNAARIQNTTNTTLETLNLLTAKLEDTRNQVLNVEEEGRKRREKDAVEREKIQQRIRELNKAK